MNQTLDWLFDNAGKVLTPQEWGKLLDVEIIDPDGWRGRDSKPLTEPIGLQEFINRLSESTIMPVR
jgi:hypothetical protein